MSQSLTGFEIKGYL